MDRSAFPQHTQLQGLSAQAAQWLLREIERNELTIYEALYIVHHLQRTVLDIMRREEAEEE